MGITKVAISGANGFVGSALLKSLQARDWDVTPIIRTAAGGATDQPKVSHISDPWSALAWSQALEDATTLIHLVGRAHHTAESGNDIEAYRKDNVHVLESVLAADSELKSIIFLSSVKAIGERTEDTPFTDETSCAPSTPYGRSKLEAEDLLHDWGSVNGRSASSIRPPLIYGPGVRGNLESLIRLANSPVPLPLNSLNNRRSLLAVDNLTSAIESLAGRSSPGFDTFTISDPTPVSTSDIVTYVRIGLGRSPRLFTVPLGALRIPFRVIGQGERFARLTESLEIDPTPAYERLGVDPIVDTPTGLTQLGELVRHE